MMRSARRLNSRLTKSWVELFVNNADLSLVKVANFGVLLHTELCGKEISESDQVFTFYSVHKWRTYLFFQKC